MPMLQRTAHAADARADIFAQLPIGTRDSEEHALASDGVSCTVCHQISGDKLGTRDTVNGAFVLAPPTPASGARPIFGPFKIDRGRTTIMRSVTGFEQSESAHIRESNVCATCHTLLTRARGADGRIIGELPEQMTFHEWEHSAARAEKQSCQSCHMPAVTGPTRIASVMGDQRDSLARHLFVGGNAFMLRILNRFRTELGVAASPQELETTARATLRQLENDTARLFIDRAERAGSTVTVGVSVHNLTGHKLPTGYPSRRAWLHLTVRDSEGRVLFESGAVDPAGLIRGNDNDADPARVERHYEEIRTAEEVQIYESVMRTMAGAVTTGLLQAVGYVKDNRLLPRGFDKATAVPDIAAHGEAASDVDFTGDGDRVRYVIRAAADGPLNVKVELLYQPIGFRWAENLRGYDAREPRRFVSYYDVVASVSSTVLAQTTVTIR
jgi:cytochrome c551/c552